MITIYCRVCWKHIENKYGEEPPEVTILDKTSTLCPTCTKEQIIPNNTPISTVNRTHCKRGHLLNDHRTLKGDLKPTRICKICMRLAEQRHRDKNPGYHYKYKKASRERVKKKVKDA